MSSGIVFQELDCSCSNGMAEYLLDLCIQEFPNVEGAQKYSHVLEFFEDYKKMFFGGLIIFIEPDDFIDKNDFFFLSKLFAKVFEIAKSDVSELTERGKSLLESEDFFKLVPELEKYSKTI